MTSRHIGACLVLLLVGASKPVLGQQGQTCGWQYYETLELPYSLVELVAAAPPSPEVVGAVQLLHRWFITCNGTAAREAEQSLRRVRSRNNSTDPIMLGLLGIALLRGPEVQPEGADGFALRAAHRETNAAAEAFRLLEAVLPGNLLPEVAEDMGIVALAIRKESYMKVAIRALESPPYADVPRLKALRGELLLALGEIDEAISLVAGSPHPLHLRLLAIAQPADQYQESYLRGLRTASLRDLPLFYDDLRLLLGPAEVREWHGVEPSKRREWIERKWEWRAFLSGVTLEQRLSEHHRRMRIALELYPRRSFRGATPTNAAWLGDPAIVLQPLDDRGLIMLRHGEPLRELMQPRGSPIAWYYGGMAPGVGVFEFARGRGNGDYILIEPSPACKRGHVLTEDRPAGYTTVPDRIAWALDLMPYDKALAHYYEACDRGSFVAAARYLGQRTESRKENADIITTETAVPRFPTPILGTANLYGFRSGTGGEAIVYMGIPLDGLSSSSRSDQHSRLYELQIRATAGDPSTGLLSRTDTVLRFTQSGAPVPNAVAGVALAVPVASGGDYRLIVSVANHHDSAQGQVISATRRIPDRAGGLAISDVVISHDRPGAWRRGAHSLAPVLGHAVESGAPLRLFYEVYGLSVDATVDIRIQVTPSRDESILSALRQWISRRSALSIEYRDELQRDADGTVRMATNLRADLQPGSYTLHVKLTDPRTGRSASTDAVLIIVEGPR